MEQVITIRPIEPQDNAALAEIIRAALTEFGANKPGTVYFDPTTDALFELFRTKGSYYFVATSQNKVLGGCGIFPTANLPEGTCELVKLYVNKDARGTGTGKKLMEKSMEWAKENGYTQVHRAADDEQIRAYMEAGDQMGYLWKQGLFPGANP